MPQHDHGSCSNCSYQGSWKNYDVWLHLNGGTGSLDLDTIIVRYGPGGRYASWTRASFSKILSDIVIFQRTENAKLNVLVWAVLEVMFKDHSQCRKGGSHGHV